MHVALVANQHDWNRSDTNSGGSSYYVIAPSFCFSLDLSVQVPDCVEGRPGCYVVDQEEGTAVSYALILQDLVFFGASCVENF